MVVVNFPGHHRDLAGMKNDGFDFSTPSDMAVKMYDALLHQMIYHFEDPLFGGAEGTTKVGHVFGKVAPALIFRKCFKPTPTLPWAIS